MEEIHEFRKPAPSLLNRSMLSGKLFNLLNGASTTALVPFLPMFFRFLGLTAFQSGILGSVRSLVGFWSSLFWLILAEKFGKRKCVLVIFLLGGIVLNVSLGFVKSTQADFMGYTCLYNNTTEMGNSKEIAKSIENVSTKGSIASLLSGKSNNDFQENSLLRPRKDKIPTTPMEDMIINDYKRRIKVDKTLHNDTNQNSSAMSKYIYHAFGFRMDLTFQTLLILSMAAEFFVAPVRRLCESIFADVMHSNKGTKARSHIWNGLGNLLGAGLVVLVIGHYHCSFNITNTFYLHFYLYAIIGAGSFLFASLFHVYEPKTSMTFKFCKTCRFVTCNLHILSLLSILFTLGVAESLTSNFMMWYLQDINASLSLMGLMIAVSALSGLLLNCIAPYCIKPFGHKFIITVSLLAYGARFLAYSYLINPWYVLPVQILHGFSFSLVWVVCSSYAAVMAPIGMERTLNSLMSIAFWGFGHGAGGIGVALLYYQYGPVVVFRCAAGVCGVYALMFAVLQLILVIPEGSKSRQGKLSEYRQVTFDIDERDKVNGHAQDWLLEALEAAEHDIDDDDDDEDTHFIR
ncbi:major facilitator superfamily domain-containing protein 6 [Nematostella vectensis]|uniref:major facilitator superfamily domain-containing protein 6 n=1 Tax=Nematostella vectensis TaxID=45351 RepID=UPI0020775408|nr:major facilitator superfamily domain-containing protein 6 [Nematostella vectensis]